MTIPCTDGTARARVDRLVIWVVGRRNSLVWGAEGGREVFAGAAAGVDESSVPKSLPERAVHIGTPALFVRSVWAADIGALIPGNAEPAEVFECSVLVFGTAAIGVEVLHPHDEHPICLAGALPRAVEGAGMPDVEIAGR